MGGIGELAGVAGQGVNNWNTVAQQQSNRAAFGKSLDELGPEGELYRQMFRSNASPEAIIGTMHGDIGQDIKQKYLTQQAESIMAAAPDRQTGMYNLAVAGLLPWSDYFKILSLQNTQEHWEQEHPTVESKQQALKERFPYMPEEWQRQNYDATYNPKSPDASVDAAYKSLTTEMGPSLYAARTFNFPPGMVDEYGRPKWGVGQVGGRGGPVYSPGGGPVEGGAGGGSAGVVGGGAPGAGVGAPGAPGGGDLGIPLVPGGDTGAAPPEPGAEDAGGGLAPSPIPSPSAAAGFAPAPSAVPSGTPTPGVAPIPTPTPEPEAAPTYPGAPPRPSMTRRGPALATEGLRLGEFEVRGVHANQVAIGSAAILQRDLLNYGVDKWTRTAASRVFADFLARNLKDLPGTDDPEAAGVDVNYSGADPERVAALAQQRMRSDPYFAQMQDPQLARITSEVITFNALATAALMANSGTRNYQFMADREGHIPAAVANGNSMLTQIDTLAGADGPYQLSLRSYGLKMQFPPPVPLSQLLAKGAAGTGTASTASKPPTPPSLGDLPKEFGPAVGKPVFDPRPSDNFPRGHWVVRNKRGDEKWSPP